MDSIMHSHVTDIFKNLLYIFTAIYLITSCTRPHVAVAHSGATEAGTRNMEMLHVGVSVHCMFNGSFKAD
jgi:uncharacterized lipoprotein YajG